MQFLTTQADDLEDNSKFTILTIEDEPYIRQSIKPFGWVPQIILLPW